MDVETIIKSARRALSPSWEELLPHVPFFREPRGLMELIMGFCLEKESPPLPYGAICGCICNVLIA